MRIAYITDTYLPETNGIVTAIVRHARALAARGHTFLVLCPRYGPDDPGDEDSISVERYRGFRVPSNPDTHLALPWRPAVARRLRAFAPDLVHVQTPMTLGLAGLRAARTLGVPLVQTYHSYVPGFLQYARPSRVLGLDRGPRRIHDTRLGRAMTRAIYNRGDLVLAPSETLARLLRTIGVKPEVRTQTNGIDLRVSTVSRALVR